MNLKTHTTAIIIGLLVGIAYGYMQGRSAY